MYFHRNKNYVPEMEDEYRTQSTTFRRAIRFSCSPTYPSQFQNAYSDPPVAQNYSITPVHRLMGASLETYAEETQPQDIINVLRSTASSRQSKYKYLSRFLFRLALISSRLLYLSIYYIPVAVNDGLNFFIDSFSLSTGVTFEITTINFQTAP